MSLFESASLVVTPNGTKASKLYAIKPTDGSGDLTVTRATTARRVNSAGLIESVATNVPRLDYTNSTCPSILVEPQSTNVLTYSEQFGTSWVNNGATIISNDTTAPDGNLTADRLTATGGAFGVVKFSTWSATNKVASCFVKANTSNLFRIANVSGGGGSVTFNLSTQAITATTGFTGSIEALPNGWFRCVAIDTLARSGTFSIGVTAIGESVFVWGAQLEAGSYSTSYIPTTTASVTRNADVINKTGISSLIGQTEGTMFLDVNIKRIGIPTRQIYNLTSGSPNFLGLAFLSTNVLRFTIRANAGTQYNVSTSALPIGRYKLAGTYKAGELKLYVNGVLIGTNTNASVSWSSALDRLNLDNSVLGTDNFSDDIKSAALWKTALTDQECINLTTI